MKRLTLALLVVAAVVLIARELRSNPSLPGKLAREVHRAVTAKLPPAALLPLAMVIGLLMLWGFLALAGPP